MARILKGDKMEMGYIKEFGLRRTYEYLRLYEESLEEFQNKYPDNKKGIDRLKKEIRSMKQSIRKFNKIAPDINRKLIKSTDSSYVLKITLPETVKTKEDAENHFLIREYMECPNSPYDCTGKHFTIGYKLFFHKARWVVIHWVGVDV